MNSQTLPQWTIITTWIILLLYLTINFTQNADKSFIQLKFDWKNKRLIREYPNVLIDSISHDFLMIKNDFEIKTFLNPNNTFTVEDGKKSFFRSTNVKIDDDRIIFSGLKWINKTPNFLIKETKLQIVDLPLIQLGNRTITTIGDSEIIWGEGRNFRKNLSKNKDLVFLGNNKDVYGYPYEGHLTATTKDIIKALPKIAPTEIYILFFGAHDKRTTNQNILYRDVCETLRVLLNREETEEVFVITLPPSTNMAFNNFNNLFNEILINCSKINSKIRIVNLNEYLKDKNDYLLEDEVHLNAKGYHFLNKLLKKDMK